MMILSRRHFDAESNCATQMNGEYRLVVRKADGRIKRDTGWFSNLILDIGLNRIGSGSANDGCAIGTGTAAPAANQTALQAHAAWTTTLQVASSSAQVSAPYYYSQQYTYRFALGALNGNYTEVGVGWSAANLFSRALIVDGVGAPTTITVLADEQLDVTYRLRLYLPASDWGGSVVIGGTTHSFVGRAASATSNAFHTAGNPISQSSGVRACDESTQATVYSGAIGSVVGLPSGSTANASVGTNLAYVNNSLSKSGSYPFPLNSGNVAGGIKSIYCRSPGLFFSQYEFSPPIPKDANKTLTLNFTVSWARRP